MDKSKIVELLANADSSGSGETIIFSTESAMDLQFLDAKKLRIEYFKGEIDPKTLANGIHNLTRLKASMKREVLGQAFRWYQNNIKLLGYRTPEEAIKSQELDQHIPPKSENDIAGLLKFFSITGGIRRSDGRAVVSVRGDTAWDCEHGIALFFENGERLVKVGDLNEPFE